MTNFWVSVKDFIHKLRFRLSAAEYMRVAYLSPRQVVLITTRLDSKDNIMPVDWHMPLSIFPKMYCVSLTTGNFTSKIIDKTKCFGINFVSAEMEEKILACGRASGADLDKFELTGIEKSSAEKIDVPMVRDAIGWLECKVKQQVITGDHTLYIAKIVHENMNRSAAKQQLHHITSVKG